MQDLQRHLEERTDRVREHSALPVNRRIDQATQASVDRCRAEGRDAIARRLAELDHEWDIDRVLMANFAVVGGAAYAMGLRRYAQKPLFGRRPKGLLYLVGAQLGFLMLHATVGWCPPVAIWRRFGYRTKSEIEVERSMLLSARSDNGSKPAANQKPLPDSSRTNS